MMELIKLRYVKINIIFVVFLLILSNSCQEKTEQGRKLECILEGINITTNDVDILVGQHDGWTDSTTLITIIFEDKSMNIPKNSMLKGRYKGNDIYFNQGKVDTLDTREYEQIPNNIKWNTFAEKMLEDDFIQPPYNPISVQVEYNTEGNCVFNIVKGKEYVLKDILSKCDCKNIRNK